MTAELLPGQTADTIEVPDWPTDGPFGDPTLSDEQPVTPEAETVPAPSAQGEPPATGQEQTPAPSQEPEAPAPPAYLANIPAEERQAVIEGLLAGMSREEREALAPIAEVVSSARQSEAARTRQQERQGLADAGRQQQLASAAETFVTRLREGMLGSDALEAEANNFAGYSMQLAVAAARTELNKALNQRAQALGVQWTPEVTQAANAAFQHGGLGAYYDTFINHLVSEAGNVREQAGRANYEKAAAASLALDKARHEQEVIARLAKEGRLIDSTPPILGAGVADATGAVSDEEFNAALQNDALMEQLMADPVKGPWLRKEMALAMAGSR